MIREVPGVATEFSTGVIHSNGCFLPVFTHTFSAHYFYMLKLFILGLCLY